MVMASLPFAYFLCLPRCRSNNASSVLPKFAHFPGFSLRLESRKWGVAARKKLAEEGLDGDEGVSVKKKKRAVSTNKRTRKKVGTEMPLEEVFELEASGDVESVESTVAAKKAPRRTRKKAVSDSTDSEEVKIEKKVRARRTTKKKEEDDGDLVSESEASEIEESQFVSKVEEVKTEKKVRGRRKTKQKELDGEDLVSENEVSEVEESPFAAQVEEGKTKKVRERKTKPKNAENEVSEIEEFSFVSKVKEVKNEKKVKGKRETKPRDAVSEDLVSEYEMSENEESPFVFKIEDEKDEELNIEEGEDISFTYGWPPLVCCFGAAQHAFVSSGRPANRLLNYEIHERNRDAYWAPEKFVRAPGGTAGSVALALASLGGKVAFMGKLGTDSFGEAMIYYMNVNSVQTRSVRVDANRLTAISQMKISKTGRLRTACVKPCAEDSLLKSEINIDVLKEAKMFYFSTHSLLDPNMRSTTLRAIRISKKLGAVIFYDVNLPMPLWLSSEETKAFVHQVWNLADIIEVTKQELEFLCGITPLEEFDTKNNASSKFIHYGPEVVEPLWHENLKVLFVTNGTSKIHYYTKEHNGSVHGMEDPHLTPFTADMSASGDGIVAAILRLLTIQPDLITDKGYLEHTIRFAINCGVIDQWALGRERGFPPEEDDAEEVTPDENGIMSVTEREFRTLKPVS